MFGERARVGGMSHSLLAIAVAAALAGGLAGCGGGSSGGNLKSGSPTGTPVSPPTSPPPPLTPTSPPPPPPPLVQPAIDAHLTLINATPAQLQGYTGAGYRIGLVDSGVNRNHPALAGRVAANLVYIGSAGNDLSVDDKVGHGTEVAQLAAGAPVGKWPGGVAQGATILSARIIADESPDDDGSGEGNEVTGAIGIKSINQDLAARGMRIMNNSWGGLYWTKTSATAAIADEYRFFIRDYDGLVVFATGNESRSDPSDMAALPSQPGPNGTTPAADLERGWLAVAALDTANPTALMYYSNACGVAMHYCLVAPGTVSFTGANDTATSISYWYGTGTSFAAPLVSGAAAVVWQKFPYFNNDLVRQTLLGTATDLGDPGVDAVFGYGLLDVAKALGGPAKFDWGDVTVSFSGNSAWTNAITGTGGLIKQGDGTLSLGSAGTALDYLGDTRVQGGTLKILGDLHKSNVQVAAGGRLAGTRALGANLTNAGTVLIDEAAAGQGLSVAGDYVQKAGSQLSLIVGYGQLLVGGKATLEGGNLNVAGLRSGYTWQAREYVLTANGGLSGQFSALTSASSVFLTATLGYSGTQAWMDIGRLDVSAAAQSLADATPAALGAAQRMETAFEQIDAQQGGDGGAIADGFIRTAGEFQHIASADAASASLRSLSGEVHAAAQAATFDALDLGRRALSARFDTLASGQGHAGGWLQGLNGTATPLAGVAAQTGGWLGGRDVALGNATVAGVAFGESRSDSQLEGLADRSRERQVQTQAYLGRQWNQAYLLGQFGAGQWQRQIDRQLLIGDARYGLHSDYDGDFAVTGLEAGYRFDGAAGTLVPYLGAEYARVASDGFREDGADGFGLRSNGGVATRSQAIAGLRAGRQWRSFGVNGYVEWEQTLASDGLALQASFVGADAWSPLAASDPARSGGMFGLSARAWLTPASALSFGYDQRFGPRGDAGLVSLRYSVGF